MNPTGNSGVLPSHPVTTMKHTQQFAFPFHWPHRTKSVWWFLMPVLAGAVSAAELGPNDVVKKSEAAYAALKSYVGTTRVQMTADITGIAHESFSSAKVTFVRPGKVRIEGTTSSQAAVGNAGHAFTIVSDGQTTWHSWPLRDNGAFKEVKGVESAGMGGVAQGAAETMAVALLKSDGGRTGGSDPFIVPRLAGAKLEGREKIGGDDCYKLVSKSATLEDVTLWIDAKTFLIRQMRRETDGEKLAATAKKIEEMLKAQGKEPPASRPPIRSMVRVLSFEHAQVDGPVDEKLFADPTK